MVLPDSEIHCNFKLVNFCSPLAIHPCPSKSSIFCQDSNLNQDIQHGFDNVIMDAHFSEKNIRDEVKNILSKGLSAHMSDLGSCLSSFILQYIERFIYIVLLIKEFNEYQKSQPKCLILTHQMCHACSRFSQDNKRRNLSACFT